MTRSFVLTVAMVVWLACHSIAVGQGVGGKGRGGAGGAKGADSHNAPSDYYRGSAPPPQQTTLTPHGGEYLVTDTNQYEVVYMPLQVRIYLFDDKRKPLSARDVHAQMSLKLPSENTVRQVPFQYVGTPPGSAEQDFVVAVFDFRQLKDQETAVTFKFSGRADKHHPTMEFSPMVSSSKIRPYVARVLVTEADREGVMRQRVCPVSGQALGSQGPIVKLYIADYPLYVCDEDCLAAVREKPARYLPQPSAAVSGR